MTEKHENAPEHGRGMKIGMGSVVATTVLAMALVLVACTPAETVSHRELAYIGTWDLVSDGSSSNVDYADMRDKGLDSYLVIDAEGGGAMVMLGSGERMSWRLDDDGNATIELPNGSASLAAGDDGNISLSSGGGTMLFTKGEARKGADVIEALGGDRFAYGQKLAIDEELASDDKFTVTGTRKILDDYGDPCLVLSVDNHSGKNATVSPEDGTFTVGGIEKAPVGGADVPDGSGGEVFVRFDHAASGMTDADDIRDVYGTVMMRDADTRVVIATYRIYVG